MCELAIDPCRMDACGAADDFGQLLWWCGVGSAETYIFQNLKETVIEMRRYIATCRANVAGDDNFRRYCVGLPAHFTNSASCMFESIDETAMGE